MATQFLAFIILFLINGQSNAAIEMPAVASTSSGSNSRRTAAEGEGRGKSFSMNQHRKKYLKRRLHIMNEVTRMSTNHEVVVAVNQNNLDKIEKELDERSNPQHMNYQQWLSFDEIGEMTRNNEATAKVNSQWTTAERSNATILT